MGLGTRLRAAALLLTALAASTSCTGAPLPPTIGHWHSEAAQLSRDLRHVQVAASLPWSLPSRQPPACSGAFAILTLTKTGSSIGCAVFREAVAILSSGLRDLGFHVDSYCCVVNATVCEFGRVYNSTNKQVRAAPHWHFHLSLCRCWFTLLLLRC
jgi:hypothetical protein